MDALFLYRQSLVAKNLSEKLARYIECSHKMCNLYKARPLNQRLFSFLCDELHADHTGLLWYTKVHYLSRVPVLQQVLNSVRN